MEMKTVYEQFSATLTLILKLIFCVITVIISHTCSSCYIHLCVRITYTHNIEVFLAAKINVTVFITLCFSHAVREIPYFAFLIYVSVSFIIS
jgi:hypothetical protein